MGETQRLSSLLAGGPYTTRQITLKSGQDLAAGTVLGETYTIPTTGTADAGNTGDGTVTGVVGKKNVQKGVYTLVSDASDFFTVYGPNGQSYGGAAADALYDGPISFTANDGSTSFEAGDKFTIEVTSAEKYKIADADAVDGSQHPDLILLEDCDASLADTVCLAYETGQFNSDEIVLDDSFTVADIQETLRDKGILLANV